MKARKVNEDINFEKGQDPKKAMNIGQGELLDMIKGMDAFTHWLYYAEHDFVDQVWGDSGLKDHIQSKLRGYIGDGYMDAKVLMKFVRELDTGNMQKLYRYIAEHHSDKW